MKTTTQLAEFVTGTRYETLPKPVRHAAHRIILDTIGCILGALGTSPGLAVRQVVKMQGGDGATVLGTGQRAGAMTAAYANGRLANVLDFDECYMVQGHHAQSTLGSALALCETAGQSGQDLITAFAVGFEVGIRFGDFLSPRVSVDADGKAVAWTGLAGPGQGVYAACAAACNLWCLTPEQVSQAFGLCAQYMVGRDWNRHWGADLELGTIKYADTGWNAQAGMMAALAAREGVTGIKAIFDRDSFGQMFKGVILNRQALTEELATRWSVQNTSIKFWPCCRWIHYPLTGFAELIRENSLSADEIQSVDLCSFPLIPNPSFSNQHPANLVAATMSFPHAAAMVALNIPAGPEWFARAQMDGERASAFRKKVQIGIDPAGHDPNAWGLKEGVLKVPSHARIKARGTEFVRTSMFALGDPWSGAPRYGDVDIEEKFRRQALTLAPLSKRWNRQIDTIIKNTLNLEQMNVRDFVQSMRC